MTFAVSSGVDFRRGLPSSVHVNSGPSPQHCFQRRHRGLSQRLQPSLKSDSLRFSLHRSSSRLRGRSGSGARSRTCFMAWLSFLGPSVIAARKFLHVSGRFSFLPPTKGREAERRKAHLNRAAACFPDCRKTEAHGNASQRPAAATSSTLGPDFRARARANSPSRQVSPPFARLVQPLKAAPRSGHGRLPKAPRVRRVRPPRPQAPHPAPRYKRPGNAPLTGTG
jgi:hypothetical protein